MRSMNDRRSSFVPLLISLGIVQGLIAGEILLRILGIGYGSSPLESHPILHHVHPKDYLFKVHAPSGDFGGHMVRYDADGLVVDPEGPSGPEKQRPRQRVALMGDSFVEAIQVPYKDSFCGILSRAAKEGVEVRNYGCSSYSPILYVLQWKAAVEPYHPTHVFLLLNSTDIRDDEGYARKAVYGKDGIAAVPGPGNDGWMKLLRKSYLARMIRKVILELDWFLKHGQPGYRDAAGDFVEEDLPIAERTAENVLRLHRAASASGARLIVSAVPSRSLLTQDGRKRSGPDFSGRWEAWCKANSVEFLDLRNALSAAAEKGAVLTLGHDIHLSKDGHRLVARAVRNQFPDLFEAAP